MSDRLSKKNRIINIHRRFFLLFIFIFIPVSLLTANSGYPINKIAFLDDTKYKEGSLPQFLIIGIDVSEESYFKISREGRIIIGGRLKKGLNRVQFPCVELFKKPMARRYIFELKYGGTKNGEAENGKSKSKQVTAGTRLAVREMTLTTTMDTPEFKLLQAPPPRGIFKVSIAVGDKTLYSTRKESPIPIVMKAMEKRILAANIEPPLPGLNIPLDAILKKAPPDYEYIPVLKKKFPVDRFTSKGKRYTVITTVELKVTFLKSKKSGPGELP